MIGHLQVSRRLHGLDGEVVIGQEGRDTLSKRGLPRSGWARDEDTATVPEDPLLDVGGHIVIVECEIHERPHHRDLHAVRERSPGDRDPERPDLDDRDPALLKFDKPVRVTFCPLEELLCHEPKFILGHRGIPEGDQPDIPEPPYLRHRCRPLLEGDRDRLLIEELVNRERGKVTYLRL